MHLHSLSVHIPQVSIIHFERLDWQTGLSDETKDDGSIITGHKIIGSVEAFILTEAVDMKRFALYQLCEDISYHLNAWGKMSDHVAGERPCSQPMPLESSSHLIPTVISFPDEQGLHMVLEVLNLGDGLKLLQTLV